MTDREKVMKGLECCAMGLFCPDYDCPYEKDREEKQENCIELLARDALELLKAQEPRVMTLDEINGMEWDYCYVEDEVIMDKTQRMMFGEHRIHCITWPSIASYKMFYGEAGYGKRWRCWTSRPTEEQRAATPWEKGE